MVLLRLFKGRLNRRNWAFGLLSSIAILFVILIITPSDFSTIPLGNLIYIVLTLSVLVFNISLHIRRLHDIGKSGLLLLILLLPLINIFGIFYLAFKSGEDKDNKYGKKPSKDVSYPGQILGYDVKT